jgi:anti-anti-sigma regulatory factor
MNTITLPAICDRAAARALHPDLRDAIGPQRLVVDASAVERIGQAMLQLLVSAASSEAGIAIRTPSEAFVAALHLAGLWHVIGADIDRRKPA